ncbi:hypothetical protein IJ579_05755 [bacterium]|nr:hypothetical protein [bacterium]
MNNNILLITENNDTTCIILKKLVLLRQNDKIDVCSIKDIQKKLNNSVYRVVILHEELNNNSAIKHINIIQEAKPDTQIILLLDKIEPEFILKAYDSGANDYITQDMDDWEILIKVVNCLKMCTIKNESDRNKKFLDHLDVIDSKTGLYKYAYLKEIFGNLNEDLRIKNGIFAVLTLDEKVKTKISTNRLAQTIKNNVRRDDIVATARGGIFYLILSNIDLNGAKDVIKHIQNKMGEGFTLRCGMSKIGIQSFETLDKNSKDSMVSAIQNDELCVSLTDNTLTGDIWLEDEDNTKTRHFKLFDSAYKNKLDNVITPLFFRYQKECETKLANTQVSQYTNKVESVFSLKNDKLHSELTIHHNGYTKFKIEITHSGLDSAENTKIEMPLNKLTDKELSKLLKQLQTEYKQSRI